MIQLRQYLEERIKFLEEAEQEFERTIKFFGPDATHVGHGNAKCAARELQKVLDMLEPKLDLEVKRICTGCEIHEADSDSTFCDTCRNNV